MTGELTEANIPSHEKDARRYFKRNPASHKTQIFARIRNCFLGQVFIWLSQVRSHFILRTLLHKANQVRLTCFFFSGKVEPVNENLLKNSSICSNEKFL